LAIIISYLIACIADHFVKNTYFKVITAVFAGVAAILASYVLASMFAGRSIICDPVHVPSPCETSCREIVDKAANATTDLSQKFNECLKNCMK
jgi:hypothetical protein